MGAGAKASPFSTGGGGYEYERKVAAVYLAAMACGEGAPGAAGTITEVRFQRRPAGHLLDDLVVAFDRDGGAHKLSLQVKHGLRPGASSDFRGVIAECWQMFIGGEGIAFDRSADLLGIVMSPVPGDSYRHRLLVPEMARDSADSAAFWGSLKDGGHSKHRLEFANSIKGTVTESSGSEATDDDMWRFLRLLHLIELDMDGPDAAGYTNAVEMCRRALAEPGGGEAAKLFDALRGVAADLASTGGSIGPAALRGRLSAFDLAGHAGTGADAGRLDAHSRTVMAGIGKAVGNKVALDRAPLLERLEEVVKTSAVTIIHGEPFAGKSALARLFAEKMSGRGTVMFFGTEYLGGSGSPEALLTSLGVRSSLEDILETHGTAPHRYVVIDGLDRVSYEPKKAQVAKGLLVAISDYNARATASAASDKGAAWKIIATSRNTEMKAVAGTIAQWCGGVRPSLLEVDPLTDEEIGEVCRQLPQLGGAIRGRLGALLLLPGYLDMIARWLPATSEGVPGAVGEGRLFDLFWNEAVLRRVGMREGRGHGRDREKILVDMAKRAYRGLPPADPHDLDPDAVDGLLTDGLARIVGNRLAFAHDVIEDYALARMIEWARPRRSLFEGSANTRRLVRPLRICAAKMLEADASVDEWNALLEDCRHLGNRNVWARECLLGAADSDVAWSNLGTISGVLLRNGGDLLAKLLAALPSAFLRDNPYWALAAKEHGIVEPGLHPAYYKLPRDERFAPVLSFALDNMEGLGGAAIAQFIRTAAWWSRNGANHDLKRRIAGYAVQHAGWLRGGEAILGRDYGESDEIKGLVAATIMYSSASAPDLVKKFISGSPSIVGNEHFKRGLTKEYGWAYLCKFLPGVAVDVLSRAMCTGPDSLGPLKDIPEICDDGWTDLPSPHEGPFLPFLAFHPEHGLALVHNLLNHVTGEWRRAREAGGPLQPPRIPVPQTVSLDSGPVYVYGDEYAFAWGGHAPRASNLVASALMALEVWLDSQIKNGKEAATALFDRVLQPTNSAAVVGVCCTVALGHMDKTAEAILPILLNPAFWIMDAERLRADMVAIEILRTRAMQSDGREISERKFDLAIQHASGRCKLGDLSGFAPRLLLDGPDKARSRMKAGLEAFPGCVPVFFKDDVNDEKTMKERRRRCELWSKVAHSDNYASAQASGGATGTAFDKGRFPTDGEKEAERRATARKKASDFAMWLNTFIEKNEIGPAFTIESALEYAEQAAEGGFLSSRPRYNEDGAAHGRAGLAGAMVAHRWDEAVKMGVANACLKYLEGMANTIDPRAGPSYRYSAAQPVAHALPHCYLRGGRGRGARNAIRKFADARNDAVLESLMRGLCVLWGREDKLVLECIARARRRFPDKKDGDGRSHADWAGRTAVLPALRDVPPVDDGTERKLERIIDDMLDDTIAVFKELEESRAYGGAYPLFRNMWCPDFFRVLESHTESRPELRDSILDKIASQWEAAPQLLEYFMRHTVIWGMRAGRGAGLLAAWKHLLPRVIGPRLAAWHYRNNRVKKSILALLIFADLPKAAGDEGRFEVVEGLAAEISSWCAALAGNRDAVEAVASLLADAPPALLLSRGIGWLWQVLQQADTSGLSDATVKMVSHLLYRASTCERPDGALPDHRAKYAWIVDCLVALNDPVAESLKDEGKNPYSGAGGGVGGGLDG